MFTLLDFILFLVIMVLVFGIIWNKQIHKDLTDGKKFYIRFSVPFCNGQKASGTAIYYSEEDVLKEANGDLKSFLLIHSPNFSFSTLTPIAASELKQNLLSSNISGAKKIFETHRTVVIRTATSIILASKPENTDSFKCYWFGTCFASKNKYVLREVMKALKKQYNI